MFSGRFLHTTKVRAKNSKLSLAPSPEDEVVHLKSPAESVYFPLTYPDMFLLQNLEHEFTSKNLEELKDNFFQKNLSRDRNYVACRFCFDQRMVCKQGSMSISTIHY